LTQNTTTICPYKRNQEDRNSPRNPFQDQTDSLPMTRLSSSSFALLLWAVTFICRIQAAQIPMVVYSACEVNEEMCEKEHAWGNEEPWECVDTAKSRTNCGGCIRPMYEDQEPGRDCTIIPGVRNVDCYKGACVIKHCQSGWTMSDDRGACYELYDEGD